MNTVVGEEFVLGCGTVVEVVAVVVKNLVRVKDSEGITQVVNTASLLSGEVVWKRGGFDRKARITSEEDMPEGFYVYQVVYCGEVIYIGKGIGPRYLHVKSGKSHVVELNRLFFAGEDVSVQIIKDNLNEGQALAYESELIRLHIPKCNTIHCVPKIPYGQLYKASQWSAIRVN
jgi:hypothetical protein